jgi:hypothetical protein
MLDARWTSLRFMSSQVAVIPVASAAEAGLVGYQSRWRIDEEMQWDHSRRHPFATVTHRLLTRVRVRVM